MRANRERFAIVCNASQRVASYSTVVWLDMDAFVVKPRCAWLQHPSAPFSISRDDCDPKKV